MRSMENATSSYERSNLSGGRLHGFQALAQVNEVILQLLETEQSMCQAGGGSCNSMKKSMQALSWALGAAAASEPTALGS